MTSLAFTIDDIPSLRGRIAVVTGGSSGIGFAAVSHLANKGAKTYILDLNPPESESPPNTEFIQCDITSWSDLTSAFEQIGDPDIAIANAGVSEECNYFEDTFDEGGKLKEPKYGVLEVNYRAVLNFTKLSISSMRRTGGGSIVITSSATAYAPEQSLPVYSSTKLGLIGLVRALRPSLRLANITINAVAPAATITKLLPKNLAAPLMAAGLPVSTAEFAGLALVYAAVANEHRLVEPYGKDADEDVAGRWNGRTILTLGDTYTELEEPLAKLRTHWFGKENAHLTRLQQTATDFRTIRLPN